MISKELLSEVIGERVEKIKSIQGNTISFYTVSEWYRDHGESELSSINIYELDHKVKEWAFDNRYDISTSRSSKGYLAYVYQDEACGFDEWIHQTSFIKHEPEAIFKAGEWILEQLAIDDLFGNGSQFKGR
jgi:hypothetical protein